MSDYQLNAERLLCPMPVIKVQDKIQKLMPGDILTVTCSDPGTLHDIPAWCRIHQHHVLDTQTQDDLIVFTLQVGPPPLT